MPKMPGRESTKLKFPIEELVISGFFMPWEKAYAKRECVVEGCEHRIGACDDHTGQPGMAVQEEAYQRDAREGTRKARSGPACSCCTTRLLASER